MLHARGSVPRGGDAAPKLSFLAKAHTCCLSTQTAGTPKRLQSSLSTHQKNYCFLVHMEIVPYNHGSGCLKAGPQPGETRGPPSPSGRCGNRPTYQSPCQYQALQAVAKKLAEPHIWEVEPSPRREKSRGKAVVVIMHTCGSSPVISLAAEFVFVLTLGCGSALGCGNSQHLR